MFVNGSRTLNFLWCVQVEVNFAIVTFGLQDSQSISTLSTQRTPHKEQRNGATRVLCQPVSILRYESSSPLLATSSHTHACNYFWFCFPYSSYFPSHRKSSLSYASMFSMSPLEKPVIAWVSIVLRYRHYQLRAATYFCRQNLDWVDREILNYRHEEKCWKLLSQP